MTKSFLNLYTYIEKAHQNQKLEHHRINNNNNHLLREFLFCYLVEFKESMARCEWRGAN